MKYTKFFRMFLAVAVLGLALNGCKRDDDDTDTTSAQDNSLAEGSFGDLNTMADEASTTSDLSSFKMEQSFTTPCATVTHDSVAQTITIDFGTSNCTCRDGRNRRGQVVIHYTGAYLDSGTVITITPNGYFVNDNGISGTKTVTNTGRNISGNLVWNIVVSGTIVKANNAGTVTWNSNRTREWVAGESTTTDRTDNAYLIDGSASGTNAAGGTFTVDITTALRIQMNCHNIVSGVVEFTPSSRPTRIIDYGNGSCDNQATVTINGNVYTITLP